MTRLFIAAAIAMFTVAIYSTPIVADPELPLAGLPILGDQDGSEAPFIVDAPGFELLTNVQVFNLAEGGRTDVAFDFVFREAQFDNEFGFFVVDDVEGRIDNLVPGDPDYLAVAFQRADVVFPSGSTAFTASVTRSFHGGEFLIFFIIQDNTLENMMASNPTNDPQGSPWAFFSLDRLNPDGCDHFVGFRNVAGDFTQFGFEDGSYCGDEDYNDIVYNVRTILHPVNIAPIANAGASYRALVGEPVAFDGTESFDPDGSIVLYEWDFEGDGIFDVISTDPLAIYQYPAPFSGTATLRVTDNNGNLGIDRVIVEITLTDEPQLGDIFLPVIVH